MKVTVEFDEQEWNALVKDANLNVRDAKNHLRYLVRFHLLGYKDIKIDAVKMAVHQISDHINAIRSDLHLLPQKLDQIEQEVGGLAKELDALK